MRYVALIDDPNGKLTDFIWLHNEAFRFGCDLGNDDPPIPQQIVQTFDAEWDSTVLRKRLHLNAQFTVGGGVVG